MKMADTIKVLFLMMLSFQTSCAGVNSDPLGRLKNMKAKDYFEDQTQVRFVQAVEKGEESRMRDLLKQGADVNAVGKEEMRPLFWAITKQSLSGFQFLLENGANPNIEFFDPSRERPLAIVELAAIMEDSRFLELLLKHGANPDYRPESQTRTVIWDAILNRRIENVSILIEAGADLSYQDKSGSTPMMTAAGVKNFDMVYMMLEKGADPLVKNRWGNNLIWLMKEYGDRGMKKGGEQYRWYLKVIEELKRRGLWE